MHCDELKRYDEALASYDARSRCGRTMPRRSTIAVMPCRVEAAMTRRWRATTRALTLRAGLCRGAQQSRNQFTGAEAYDEALASYDRALALRPDHAEALNNRGNALQQLKRYDEALASYDRALALEPGSRGGAA